MYKRFFCFLLNFVIIFNFIYVNVQAIPASPYDEDYTWTEYAEDAVVEAGKVLMLIGSYVGGIISGNYTNMVQASQEYSETFGTGEWVHVDSSGNVTYDQELIDLLKQFLEDYAQEHPDEVEKINYRIIHTMDYDTAFVRYADYKNALDGIVKPPEGSNSLAYWEEKWNAQTQYESFPRMILLSTYGRKANPENLQDLSLSQSFSFFEGYEKGKTTCLIGEFGGTNWGSTSEYHIGVYTYDSATGALSVDRRVTGFEQSCRFVWDADDLIWNGTENWNYLFPGSGNAYINMSGSFWGGGWGYYAQNIDQEYGKRYGAIYNSDKSVTIPVLATPNGSSFRLFATEQDALKYYETCANSSLNIDPNQVYTGGSITINNNGDVTINNNPPDGGEDTPTDSTGWLEKIYNRLGDILTQVKQIKWLTLADVVLDALDSFGGGIGNIADALVDALAQVFPLCILWDFVRIVEIFEAEPIPPVIEIPLKFSWIDETITIDLTEYETIFTILRFGEIALFLVGLFNITMSWVGKGDEVV